MIAIERTYDPHVIIDIVCHPEIWPHISDDSVDQDAIYLDVEGEYWLVVSYGEETIGLFNYHARNDCTLEIHSAILPEYRSKHAKEAGKAVLQWFYDYSPDQYQKVVAEIPSINKHVIRFIKSCGFEQEGINRMSSRNNGIICDQVLLGITRDEIGAFLKGAM